MTAAQPTPHYVSDKVTLWAGDCLDVLRTLPDNSVDSVVTDPPYGLADHTPAIVAKALGAWLGGDREHVPDGRGFMGRDWDRFVPPPAVFDECIRVLKPGGFLLSFAGSRTVDLMTTSIRFAGFEIRDSIAWLYGSGFPKSLDVSKAIDKAGGAEREVIGRRVHPTLKNPANVKSRAYHVESLDSDANAESWPITAPATEAAQQWQGWGTALKPAFEPIVVARKPLTGTVASTVLEYGTGALNIDGCRVGDGGQLKWVTPRGMGSENSFADDAWTQAQGRPHAEATASVIGRWPTNVVLDESQAAELDKQTGSLAACGGPKSTAHTDGMFGLGQPGRVYADEGGASRFFPTFRYQAKAPARERPKDADGKGHPTVKPLELMRWLVRLVTPPGGTVLDPFAGSGTTAEACLLEGFQCIAIERDADYLPLIVNRINRRIAPIAAAREVESASDATGTLFDFTDAESA
jgi:site-specific DNA-methyltransferase (adenine-specific)